jgi:Tfp pilus assembly protein PilN
MINVNLKPGAKRQAPKGDAMAGLRERFGAMRAGIREPGLLVAGGLWVLAILVSGGLYLHAQSRLHTLEPQLESAGNEYTRYRNFENAKHRAERARDSVLAQIGTITSVDQDRYNWPHILDDVSSAVPDFTWLTAITPLTVATSASADTANVQQVGVQIAGQTNDLQNYTAFLRRLSESPWLTNVLPVKTETVIDRNNRPMTNFTIQATFAHADSTHVQTVPILESTVR